MKVLTAIALASMVATCAYDRDPTGVSDVPGAETASQRASIYVEERRAVELAREIPDLAGFFVDTSGNVIVRLTGAGASPKTRNLLRSTFGKELSRGRRKNAAADLIVRTADYTFLELKGWRDRLMNADVLTTPGVVWLDLDEFQNRVVIGLQVGADSVAVRAIAQRLRVPSQALEFEMTGRYVPQQTLRDEFRPIQGGIQIQRVSGASRVGCTLGFTALWNNQNVFLTAGHCSPNSTGTDSVAQFQPLAPLTHGDSLTMSPIGREIFQYSQPCGTRRCSYSDAAIYALIPTPAWGLGRVARPASGCFPGPCNPPVLDLGTQPYWVIDTTHDGFVMGELVSEIGSATGWSQGSVQRTCVNVTPTSGVQYNCQMFASYGSNDGDSGAPILLDIQGGADSTVTLGGIHSGRSGSNAVFSPWSGIVQDYGALSVVSPQGSPVPLTAPDTVPAWVYALENLASDTGASYEYYADVMIVRFTSEATQADRQAVIDAVNGEVVGGQPMPTGEGFYYVRLSAGRRLEPLALAVTNLLSRPRVAAASLVTPLEEEYRRPKDQGDFASWDPRPDSAAGQNWGLEETAAPLAWGCETGSDSGPPIAVVDNGFHSVADLTPNVSAAGAANAQYSSQSTDHGTRVASVAGAQGDNQLRMTGMAWNADLRLYQAPLISPQTMQGIEAAAMGGAQIVNISLAVPWKNAKPKNKWKDSLQVIGVAAQLRSSLEALARQGRSILVVQAAGNGTLDAFWEAFGASVDHDSIPHQGGTRFRESILVVTASERQQAGVRKLAAFSDTGASVDLAAPGVDVGNLDRFGNVTVASGTSLAAPFVTGIGALLMAFDPTLTVSDVRQFILVGASRGGRVAIDRRGGGRTYPIVNAYEALKRAAERSGAPLCGNRVWVASTQLVAQRDTGAAPQVLADIGDTAAFVNVHHGGRRVDVWTDDFDPLSFIFNQGTWTESRTPPASPDGGAWNSLWSLSHDGDTAVTIVNHGGSGQVTLEVRRGPTGGSSTHVADIVVPLASSGDLVCVFFDTPSGECHDLRFVGTSEFVYTYMAAYSPLGDRVIVSVSTARTQTTSVGAMAACPWDTGPNPSQCRTNIDYSVETIGTTYHQITLPTGTDTVLATPTTAPVMVFWAALAEDGGQLVTGEGVFAQTSTLRPDTTGFHQRVTSQSTTACTLRYRQVSSGVVPRFETASEDVCRGPIGGGSVAPAPPISSRSQ